MYRVCKFDLIQSQRAENLVKPTAKSSTQPVIVVLNVAVLSGTTTITFSLMRFEFRKLT